MQTQSLTQFDPIASFSYLRLTLRQAVQSTPRLGLFNRRPIFHGR
jgi:hypothetical protein